MLKRELHSGGDLKDGCWKATRGITTAEAFFPLDPRIYVFSTAYICSSLLMNLSWKSSLLLQGPQLRPSIVILIHLKENSSDRLNSLQKNTSHSIYHIPY